jgi:hypothetical protein
VLAGLAVAVSLGAVAASTAAADAGPQWGAPVEVAAIPLGNQISVSHFAVADLNGDGHEDAIVTRSTFYGPETFPVIVLLGDGRGHFTDGTAGVFDGPVPEVQQAGQVVTADFNGDSRADVFFADSGSDAAPFPGHQNTLILSAPGGKLVDATANLPQASDFTHSATTGDVNGDGTIDIYVGNVYSEGRVPPRILLNDGSGHFTVGDGLLPAAQTDFDQNQYTASLLADYNGDGKLDLFLGAFRAVPGAIDSTAPSVVLLNDGTGHFTLVPGAIPPKPFGGDAIALAPASLDVTRDGKPDLVVGFTKGDPFYVGRWIQVLAGNGDGTFRDETATRLPQADNGDAWPVALQTRDLNRDGLTDFGVLVQRGPAPLYLSGADGLLQPQSPLTPVNDYWYWAFTDAEGDGANDILAVATTGTGKVFLLPDIVTNPVSQPVTTPVAVPPDRTAPVLSAFSLTPAVFAAARSGPSLARARGAYVFFSVSEPATTTFAVERLVPGTRRGHRCTKRSRSHRGRRCTRVKRMRGTFLHSAARSGPQRFRFSGRVGGRTIPPGAYRLVATPADPAGNHGRAVRTAFRIVRR